MASFSGVFQRPVTAAAALAVTAFSVDFPTILPSEHTTIHPERHFNSWGSFVSHINSNHVSPRPKFSIPLPHVIDVNKLAPRSEFYFKRDPLFSSFAKSVASNPSFLALYQAVKSTQSPNLKLFQHSKHLPTPEVMYKWHLPKTDACKGLIHSECSSAKSKTVVVLLGWLGAKQKHLKRYADWYTSQGYHAITFTFPMSQIVGYKVDGEAEQHVDMLVEHIAGWLEEEHGKNLVFHTFSNTGWLTYGVILEKFQKQDRTLVGNIRGCVVDSAPVAAPDPRVWASGFSAAFLKKQSIATRGAVNSNGTGLGVLAGTEAIVESLPAVTETALLVVLEKFFKVVLNLPKVNRRLSDVLDVLSIEQPKCPQLYIYSSADRVIPAESVESFIEEQRKTGREVRACNFVTTPHVDHFRNDPNLYTSQLANFLENSVLPCCKHTP